MKTIVTIFLIIVIIAIGVLFYRNSIEPQTSLKLCPDEKIVNRMPGPDAREESYYIQDGQRREISDYDKNWVEANCVVPEQVVY